MRQRVSKTSKSSNRRAFSLLELLLVTFVAIVTSLVWFNVSQNYDIWPGRVAGVLAAIGSSSIVFLFIAWASRRHRLQLQKLREKYRGNYRVLALPCDPRSIEKPEGAEIRIGDYGWEAGPLRKDGLIYLQGLTADWRVVWHAGFREDQIERVATKPVSQYDYWVPHWARSVTLPPCPFPVAERETMTMGLPDSGHVYDAPKRYYPKDHQSL